MIGKIIWTKLYGPLSSGPKLPGIFRSFNSKIQYDDNAFLRRRTLIVRFEDIALDELEMAEKVYDFVGLEMHPKVKHMILMNKKKRRESPNEPESKRKRRHAAGQGQSMMDRPDDMSWLDLHPKIKNLLLMNQRSSKSSKRNGAIESKKRRDTRPRVEDLNIFGKFHGNLTPGLALRGPRTPRTGLHRPNTPDGRSMQI